MGTGSSHEVLNYAAERLADSDNPISSIDEEFWMKLWNCGASPAELFTAIPTSSIQRVKDDSAANFRALLRKAIERLLFVSEQGCIDKEDRTSTVFVLYVLMRVIPVIFEDPDWRSFFWVNKLGDHSAGSQTANVTDPNDTLNKPLAVVLMDSLLLLCFCPGLTVHSTTTNTSSFSSSGAVVDIDSRELIWEAGVGISSAKSCSNEALHSRAAVLKLLLVCFSETLYFPIDSIGENKWLLYFTSMSSAHLLPFFCSLLNTVCSYDPIGLGLPYNYLLFSDHREDVSVSALQLLVVLLDFRNGGPAEDEEADDSALEDEAIETPENRNAFRHYFAKLHRPEDFAFIYAGLRRLMNIPLSTTLLPGSRKDIRCFQELMMLFWKFCQLNKAFMYYLLKSSDVLNLLMPTLYFIHEACGDSARLGLVHIGLFVLLMLSGERNFGVRLNKKFVDRMPMDLPVFNGSYSDVLILVVHKVITAGHERLASLYDCLLTIVVNISPYIKSLSMAASGKLLHLLEIVSNPRFLFASSTNHHMVFFLLETLNNIIQYQFDGNSNLVFAIIRKRHIFESLVALSLADKPGSKASRLASASSTVAERSQVFQPTEEWLQSWKQKLPVQSITRLLQVLVPQVEKICIDKSITDESDIIQFLKNGTLVGLLPVPHPILIRKCQPNEGTNNWFTSYLWGVLYLQNIAPPLWLGTNIRLFQIKEK